MKTIRNFAYAAVLGLSLFTIQPGLAAAEDPHGSFTLSHEVHFRNTVLSPGEYSFSIKTERGFRVLTLQGINGTRTDAILLVKDVDTPRADETSSLILVSHDGQSFVSALELPAYGMTLRFAIPPESASQ
ncbi:MAG: hypothetical protein WCF68_07710 [Terriglobales bacterium]